MNIIVFTSCNNLRENDSIEALKYMAERLEIVACVLDGNSVLEDLTQLCRNFSIPVYTSENINVAITETKIQSPDIGISYHYHSIIKKEVLDFPKNGIINFHPAPLPEHKGVSACAYAALHMCSRWGVTAYYMDEKADTGSIIKVNSFNIEKCNSNSMILQRINYRHLLNLFKEIVDTLASGKVPIGIPQEEGGHYFSRKQLEEEKIINLIDDKKTIDRKINALWFPPFHGANITIDGEKYTLVNQEILDELGKIYPIVLEEHKELWGGLE